MPLSLADKMVRLHDAFDAAGIDHAFGGALALAWCTQRARGTIDIDLNVFAGIGDLDRVLTALPVEVVVAMPAHEQLRVDGQARVWWDITPIDVFLNTTDFHEHVASRVRRERFVGHGMPFLSCTDLAVFKAFFNRTKDWADLEEMVAADTLDHQRVLGVLADYLGLDDERVARFRALAVGR